MSTTFQPENPLENAIIDNPGLVRRRRRKTNARELEILETAFRECEKPSKEVREDIARRTGMDVKAVQVRILPGRLGVGLRRDGRRVLMVGMVPKQTAITTTIAEAYVSYNRNFATS
jgi:hypothetical protein